MVKQLRQSFIRGYGDVLLPKGFFLSNGTFYKVDVSGEYLIAITLVLFDTGRNFDVRIAVYPFAEKIDEIWFKCPEGPFHLHALSDLQDWSFTEDRDYIKRMERSCCLFVSSVIPILETIHDERTCFESISKLDTLFYLSMHKEYAWTAISLHEYRDAILYFQEYRERRYKWIETMQSHIDNCSIIDEDERLTFINWAKQLIDDKRDFIETEICNYSHWISILEDGGEDELQREVRDRKKESLDLCMRRFKIEGHH